MPTMCRITAVSLFIAMHKYGETGTERWRCIASCTVDTKARVTPSALPVANCGTTTLRPSQHWYMFLPRACQHYLAQKMILVLPPHSRLNQSRHCHSHYWKISNIWNTHLKCIIDFYDDIVHSIKVMLNLRKKRLVLFKTSKVRTIFSHFKDFVIHIPLKS